MELSKNCFADLLNCPIWGCRRFILINRVPSNRTCYSFVRLLSNLINPLYFFAAILNDTTDDYQKINIRCNCFNIVTVTDTCIPSVTTKWEITPRKNVVMKSDVFKFVKWAWEFVKNKFKSVFLWGQKFEIYRTSNVYPRNVSYFQRHSKGRNDHSPRPF